MKKLDFTRLPINTPVWHPCHGWGKLVRFSRGYYRVQTEFEGMKVAFFLKDGRHDSKDIMGLLSTVEYSAFDERSDKIPSPVIKVGTMIFVKNYKDKFWNFRPFNCVTDDGRIETLANQLSFSTWDEYSLEAPSS